MCGIIGFIGKENAEKILTDGLKALEYRGYDSSGIAIGDIGSPMVIKCVGRVARLEEELKSALLPPSARGIAHTRWATHGEVTRQNSHPHSVGRVTLVHNGIIENYYTHKSSLTAMGYDFVSDTDSEVAAALIDLEYKKTNDPKAAIFAATEQLEGSYAFAIIFSDIKDRIYSIKSKSPLIAAHSSEGSFVASDITPVIGYTKDIYRPNDGVLMALSSDRIEFTSKSGKAERVSAEHIDITPEDARKGNFPHFMLKEIFETPNAVRRTVSSYLKNGLPFFEDALPDSSLLDSIKRIHIIACGTAMHAGLIGKRLIEKLARIPVNVECASEFRYKDPIISSGDLLLCLSQSGETADTLACLRYAKAIGIPTLSVVNVYASSIAVESDGVIYTKAGPEIAVASTKAYVVQCSVLALIALQLAGERCLLSDTEIREHTHALLIDLPLAIESLLERDSEISKAAKALTGCEHAFFIGRGIDSDICTEGSLKLKEISYIHSEAYPAGELKHGTISLISNGSPVIACISDPNMCKKMISGINEVRARGADVTLFTAKNIAKDHAFDCKSVLTVDDLPFGYSFLPTAVALQLLAYHVASQKGLDVDKPRNLAKSVTVE